MSPFVIGLSVVTLFAPAAAVAAPTAEPAARVVVERPDPADRLAEEAYRLFTDRRTWGKAARLLERAASMRALDDPRRAADYSEAARVYVHVGDLAEARDAFEAAARAAAERGAIVEAAHAYFDAATVAVLRGDSRGAGTLIEKGTLLSHSPHISGAQRASILTRLPETTARGD